MLDIPPVLQCSTYAANIQVERLVTPALPVGAIPDNDFDDNYCEIECNSTLCVFSDGAYEVHTPDKWSGIKNWSWHASRL